MHTMTTNLLEPLGWALLHSVWQITLIAILLAAARAVFESPSLRYGLALLALGACILWPAMTFMTMAPPSVNAALAAIGPSRVANFAFEGAEQPATDQAVSRTLPIIQEKQTPAQLGIRYVLDRCAPWAARLWVICVALLSLRQLGGLWYVNRLRHQNVELPTAELSQLLHRAITRLRVRRQVTLLVSHRVAVPIVVGSLRPLILIPTALLAGVSPVEMEALLAHELAHIRRWDDVINLAQCAVETLLFYHPAVWWISRVARQDRELCCDDLAVGRGVEANTLALALGKLATLPTPQQPMLAATGDGDVLRRIKRLLTPKPPRVSNSAWLMSLALLALLPSVSHWTTSSIAADNQPRGRILDRRGEVLADCDEQGMRRYPQRSIGGHVVGYTGFDSLKEDRKIIGRAGIERSLDRVLRERQDVRLTLDLELQKIAGAVLREHCKSGAAVVMDPQTGEVLVLAAWPTFDPNQFIPKIGSDSYKQLSSDKAMPLLGRASQCSYFPGGAYQLVTILAGLKSGALGPDAVFASREFKIGDRTYRNWSKVDEGPMDIVTAIKRRSNTWTYQAALQVGVQPLIDMAAVLGFGTATGIPLPESSGFVPTEEFYEKQGYHGFSPGILASLSIGQIAEATPLQVAVATSAIANGGTVWPTRLCTEQKGKQEGRSIGVKSEHLALIRQGLVAAVNDKAGIAKSAKIEGPIVAGITSTAMWRSSADGTNDRWLAWFTGFAPADNPQVVVTVVYEGSVGERINSANSVGPMARKIMQAALARAPFVRLEDSPTALPQLPASPPALPNPR
jgi:beta-lactamase regulating signal transducer with metallopeptidase domain